MFKFDCMECGREIVYAVYPLGLPESPYGKMCNACMMLPGWFKEPHERELISPKHSGKDLADKAREG